MTILCATDFSPCSLAATDLAATIARRLGDELLLLHVVEPLPFPPEAPPAADVWAQAMVRAAETSTERAARGLAGPGLTLQTRILTGGAGSLILDTARDMGARFIVLGTHGRKGPAHLFLGSVAEHVARHAPCPVIVTRETPGGQPWFSEGPLRLAVALDGTDTSATALAWIHDMSRVLGCDLTAIRLYWPPEEAFRYGIDEPWLGSEGSPELLSLLRRDLLVQLQPLCPDGQPRIRLRAAGRDAADALAAEAAALKPDALVVAVPHGRHHWNALTLGAVLRTAPVPVICIPPAVATSAKPIPEVRSMLVATDLSEPSKDLVRRAYGQLRASGGHVDLLHVHSIESFELPASPPLTAEQRSALEAKLQALVPPDARSFGIETKVSVVEGRTAAEAILQAADRGGVDLIAVGSHGRTGIKRALLGSVAEAVARHASRPVVILRAP
jgi:nucleotide-binding universal stress UspA family protein